MSVAIPTVEEVEDRVEMDEAQRNKEYEVQDKQVHDYYRNKIATFLQTEYTRRNRTIDFWFGSRQPDPWLSDNMALTLAKEFAVHKWYLEFRLDRRNAQGSVTIYSEAEFNAKIAKEQQVKEQQQREQQQKAAEEELKCNSKFHCTIN